MDRGVSGAARAGELLNRLEQPLVVYVSRRFPPSVGGMQRLSAELVQALGARLPLRAAAWGGSQALLPFVMPGLLARAALWLVRARASGRRPVLLAGDGVLTPFALATGRVLGVPVACVLHGLDFVYPHVLFQAVVPPAVRHADLVIAISQHVRQLAIAGGVRSERCIAVPCAIQPDPLPDRREARRALAAQVDGIDEDRPLLLTVGRLVARKGVAGFLETAFPAILGGVPDALYVVAGSGPELERVRAAAAPLANNVRLVAHVDDRTRSALYAAADLMILPNRQVPGDAEGFGLVAIEAAHAGLPVAAYAVEGIAESVVDGESGVLVSPGQWRELAEVAVGLLRDRAALADLARTARETAEARFSWSTAGDQYAQVLRSIAEGRR